MHPIKEGNNSEPNNEEKSKNDQAVEIGNEGNINIGTNDEQSQNNNQAIDKGNGESGSILEEYAEATSSSHHASAIRHTPQQIELLEELFKQNANPPTQLRIQWSKDLGLDPKQIRSWFQNKKSQIKGAKKKEENNVLRVENDQYIEENQQLKEVVDKLLCPDCRGQALEDIKEENARLQEELERVSKFVDLVMDDPLRPMHQAQEPRRDDEQHQNALDLELRLETPKFERVKKIEDWEKPIMIEIAKTAMEELKILLTHDDPLWVKFPWDEKYVLDGTAYDELFTRDIKFKGSNAWIESSKVSIEVAMPAAQLVDKLMGSVLPDALLQDEWKNYFPTIINKASTLEVIDNIDNETEGAGPLKLVFEEMHSLSPLADSRKYIMLRYCEKSEPNCTFIVDVSYDYLREVQDASDSQYWRHPSGCMVQDIGDGKSKVIRIEHVEIEDNSAAQRFYGHFFHSFRPYGASRWLYSLQWICNRSSYTLLARPSLQLRNNLAVTHNGGNIATLSYRMIKNFVTMLTMSNLLQTLQSQEHDYESNQIQLFTRKNDSAGQPAGMIISGVTSLWLPKSKDDLYHFFNDENNRAKWDMLFKYRAGDEILSYSSNISHSRDRISIVQPPFQDSKVLLRESYSSPSEALLIYSLVSREEINSVLSGEDTSIVEILPSGLIILSDQDYSQMAYHNNASTSSEVNKYAFGSLLILGVQVLLSPNLLPDQFDDYSLSSIRDLVGHIVRKINEAFGCSSLI